MMKAAGLVVALALWSVQLAHAESWTVTGPGGVTYVDRNPVDPGGLLVRPPGEPMAIVTPNGVGTGYMVVQPGRPTRYINRSGE